MKLLLDTGVLIWWSAASPVHSDIARDAIAAPENTVLVSAASAWEIATKVRIGKLPQAVDLSDNIEAYCSQWGFNLLPITVAHGHLAGRMAGAHKNPFDRMLAAQALLDDLTFVTNDAAMSQFGHRILW